MGQTKLPGSVRSIATVSVGETTSASSGRSLLAATSAMAITSAMLGVLAGATRVDAQTTAEGKAAEPGAQLPPIQVTAPQEQHRANGTASPRADRGGQKRHRQVARRSEPQPPPAPKPFAQSQDARAGAVGIYANNTSVATKTNTPLVNIPQSLSVLTKDFVRDQGFTNLTDVTRYVPGVAVHQGEGNRDELVIRGVNSSANFFVNGFRDDVQYFRDFYNTQSIEVLKGPAALTFGRGAGGGIVNRTLKEADGVPIYEATAQTGSYGDRRFTLDAGRPSTRTWQSASMPFTRVVTPSATSAISSATKSIRRSRSSWTMIPSSN